MVALVGGIIDEWPDLHDVGLPVFSQHVRFSLHIDNLADKLGVQADLYGVQQATLQDDRKFVSIGRIHQSAPDRGQAADGELVHVTPRGDADVIGLHHPAFAGDSDRKGLVFDDAGPGIGRLAQGYRDTGRL